MDPVQVVSSLDVLQTFGSAALVVATVAAIDQARPLEGRGKLVVGGIVAAAVTVIWAAANPPIVWSGLPLDALVSWLTAMGTWSGGKALLGK